MDDRQEIINEAGLVEGLEPSDTFAELITRIAVEVGVGSLGPAAVRTVVKERAVPADAETAPAESSASATDS